MNGADRFIRVITESRDFLVLNKDITPGCGCPLRVAISHLFADDQHESIWCCWDTPVDPCPEDAAKLLFLDDDFTRAVADAWDTGLVILEPHYEATQMSGFLSVVTLRPPPLLLTA